MNKKKCPLNSKLACGECRFFITIGGNVIETCAIVSMARNINMLSAKGAAGSIPLYTLQK